jgi:uncharacterized membrane protein
MNTLLHGVRGHPIHPPLTDGAIGMYTLAAALGIVGALGWIDESAAGKAMFLALVGGLIVGALAATTGLLDLLTIDRASATFRVALYHALSMVTATVLFLLAAIVQYSGYDDGTVTGWGLALTLVAFAALSLGGWLGGALVFRHGMRVEEDTAEATKPASVTHRTRIHGA